VSLPFAAISSIDVSYLSVVATVIPVILIAYILNLHDRLGRLAERLGRELRRGCIFSIFAPGQKMSDADTEERLSGYRSLFLLFVLVSCAIILPSAAEFFALRALATNRLSSFGRLVTVVGTIAAGLVLVVPLVWETLGMAAKGYRTADKPRSPSL
jgi:hypothetical protein